MDKTALIKPFKVLLLLHLLIAFDTLEVLHGGRRGALPHVGKSGNVQIKIGIEKLLQIDVPLSPLDLTTHVLGSFLSSPVKLNRT